VSYEGDASRHGIFVGHNGVRDAFSSFLAGLAALEDELDAWAQFCREEPEVGLYQFVLPIDDELYWFVNVFDPVNYDEFHELPKAS
jgi:hypothetical protein